MAMKCFAPWNPAVLNLVKKSGTLCFTEKEMLHHGRKHFFMPPTEHTTLPPKSDLHSQLAQ
jgi:hypothetical protein